MKSLSVGFLFSLLTFSIKVNCECWAEKYGYSCCKDADNIKKPNYIERDTKEEDAFWSIENGKYCGLPRCWSYGLSDPLPCCSDPNVVVEYTDKEGNNWGVENGAWCGIMKTHYTGKCWSMKLNPPVPCCTGKDLEVIKKDSNGEWSEENGEICGIPVIQEDDESSSIENCWSFKEYGDMYNCCKYDSIAPTYTTNDGLWHLSRDDNGKEHWCAYRYGIPKWNDRASFNETKDQWEDFKSRYGEGKEIDVNDFQRLSVLPGEDESKLNFGWYSKYEEYPLIRFGTSKDLTKANEITGISYQCKYIGNVQYYCNQVTVTGLESVTTYYYQRNLNGNWEDVIEFKTKNPNNFRFVFLGDPQIGASKNNFSNLIERGLTEEEGLRNDAFNWNMTIYNSYAKANEASIILSAGDNADSGQSPGDSSKSESDIKKDLLRQEREYSTLLLPKLMQQVPFAPAVGNHESYTSSFRFHFNTPNSYLIGKDESSPGYSYFFKHNNVLVIVLETNYGTEEEFREVIENACKTFPDVDWRVALFHHDIYSNGYTHSQEGYIIDTLRKELTNLFDIYDIDLVINGHDHIYAASHFITYDEKSKEGYKISEVEKNKVCNNHKGTMYVTANCSTGNKLYGFITDRNFDYVYYNNQTFTSTFGILDFTNNNGKAQMVITSYEVDNYNVIDGPYTFEKDSKVLPIPTPTPTPTPTQIPTPIPGNCWSLPDYPCCSDPNTTTLETDDRGEWGIENNDWCGIIREETCWSLPDYPCCSDPNTTTLETDDRGEWGIENNDWCGIRKNNNSITTTRTTTRTTTTTTTTRKTTTTTTRRTTTTTTTTTKSPEPSNCAPKWQQCGGTGHTGPTCCESGSTCVKLNDFYYQCI